MPEYMMTATKRLSLSQMKRAESSMDRFLGSRFNHSETTGWCRIPAKLSERELETIRARGYCIIETRDIPAGASGYSYRMIDLAHSMEANFCRYIIVDQKNQLPISNHHSISLEYTSAPDSWNAVMYRMDTLEVDNISGVFTVSEMLDVLSAMEKSE